MKKIGLIIIGVGLIIIFAGYLYVSANGGRFRWTDEDIFGKGISPNCTYWGVWMGKVRVNLAGGCPGAE